MSLVLHFNESCRFVRALANAPMAEQSTIDATRASQIDHLISIIDTSVFQVEEATQLLEAFGSPSPFVKSDIDKLSLRVQAKCAAGTAAARTPVGRMAKMQEHLCMYNYFTKGDWEHLRSETTGIEYRFAVLFDRALSIGLFFRRRKLTHRC